MIIDMHYHLDESMMTIGSLLEKMNCCGVDKTVLMAQLVDPIKEPGDSLICFAQALFANRYTRNIARLLVANFTKEGNLRLTSGVISIFRNPDNAIVFDALKNNPSRFLAWVFVNPAGDNDPAAEYLKWRGHTGCVGIKAHPFWHRYSPLMLAPVAELAARDGRPLLIHPGFGDHGDFYSLRREVPDLKIILAHAGFPHFKDTWKRIKADKNIMVDFSSNHYVSVKTIRDAVEYLGAERCMFGTDGPFGRRLPDGTMDYGLIKRRIEKIFPDKRVQRLILGENFLRFAGIPSAGV